MLDGALAAGTRLENLQGDVQLTQTVERGTLVEVDYIAPYSIAALSEAPGNTPAPDSAVTATQANGTIGLENQLIRVEISANGDITLITDKATGREVLVSGTVGNALLVFEDRPMKFDAWDIDIFYEDRTEKIEGVERIIITETGPLRAAVQIERRYRSSRIRQTIYLYRDSKRIEFDTWIDWHEQHILLKTAFPVDILSPFATFDVQWGNVQRPTHRNTSWEMARFETCAHKWADLSEGDYGVALLNDCKYGYDILNNVMRLTLLKSATSPDEHADQGEHLMTYSLLPHVGDWRGDVIPQAYDLNDPLIVRRVSGAAGSLLSALVSVDALNVVIETVKRAEDGNGLIVRLYEDQRRRGPITLTTGLTLAGAYHCNLLEENEQAIEVRDNQLQIEVTPYQIVTLRLILMN